MTKLGLAYALTGKNRDQFHVPGKEAELVSFVGAGLLGSVLLVALFLVRLDSGHAPILLAVGALTILIFVRGIRQRQHRLARVNEVEDLRARLAKTDHV